MTDPGNVRGWRGDYLKTPAFCGGRGEGREKQGQKMKKLNIIIAVFMQRSTEKPPSRKIYPRKTLLYLIV